MGRRAFKFPGPIGGGPFHLGRHTLKKPSILSDLDLLPLNEGGSEWETFVKLAEPAKLASMLSEIYDSQRWQDPDRGDKESNLTDPRNVRLPDTSREDGARQPTDKATLRLKDPTIHITDDALEGTAIFVLEIPTSYGETFDSPTPILVQITSEKLDGDELSFTGRATALGKLVRVNFKQIKLHYDALAIVKAAGAIALDKGIRKETLEQLLSNMRVDVSAMGWITILPTWAWLSASSLLPLDHPLLGTEDRLLPIQFGALPDSSFVNVGTIAIPSGVFFDTPAPAAGAHWSKFGRDRGFSLTAGVVGTPNLDQIGKDWGRAFSVYGYADLYYVKRVSETIDLGLNITYAIDVFGKPAAVTPAHLHFDESKYQDWLPSSRENVPPREDRSGQRFMFTIGLSHDLLGGR